MTSKLDKLLSTRERIAGDLEYHVQAVKTFNKETNPTLIAYRERALDVAFETLLKNRNALDGMTYDTSAAIQTNNRKLEDEYHAAKAHLPQFSPKRKLI